jgi:enterochelin esterase family protein
MSAPSVIEQRLIFTVDDPDRQLARIGLDIDDAFAGPRRFRRTASGWSLAIPRPPVARVEYRLILTTRAGETDVVCDPGNPERVRTAFGERSVALMPGYERPQWLQREVRAGTRAQLSHSTRRLGRLPVTAWSPDGLEASSAAPLLVVNDGPEYADLADLAHYAAAMVDEGRLPAFRMALMQPVERDDWYAANPSYVKAAMAAVQKLGRSFATTGPLVFMGASLGGLCATLSALAAGPDVDVGGVFTQSGSFFQPRTDPQESSYPYFDRVTESVAGLLAAGPAARRLAVGMTCGAMEENLANNQAVARALSEQGHQVVLREVPDLHNYTAWRDSLDPTLTEVLQAVWGARG